MIGGIFHQGSGLGNQLFRYVATRVLAEDKGLDFGMVAPEHFKGASFMKLDMGTPIVCSWSIADGGKVIPISSMASFEEKKVMENGVDIRGYDPEINFVPNNTIIDGEFQDDKYFGHRLSDVNKWLRVEQLGMPNDVCVIGFRGGEITGIPELRFLAVTDDPESARAFLPEEVRITHDISEDWRKIRYAKYLIIANSSFYILPSLLNDRAEHIIAPRYWARRNTGVWALPQNFYRRFHYV